MILCSIRSDLNYCKDVQLMSTRSIKVITLEFLVTSQQSKTESTLLMGSGVYIYASNLDLNTSCRVRRRFNADSVLADTEP